MDFQERVNGWMQLCFGPAISADKTERVFRFIEEALELAQSQGVTRAEIETLVGYVFSRPAGEPAQEVGGVMVCIAALCNAARLSMDGCGEAELARCWKKIDRIRAKHAAKTIGIRTALPGMLVPSEAKRGDEQGGGE